MQPPTSKQARFSGADLNVHIVSIVYTLEILFQFLVFFFKEGSAIIFGLCYWYLSQKGMGELLFWIASGWTLWLLLVYDVLWYEVHIPLVIF